MLRPQSLKQLAVSFIFLSVSGTDNFLGIHKPSSLINPITFLSKLLLSLRSINEPTNSHTSALSKYPIRTSYIYIYIYICMYTRLYTFVLLLFLYAGRPQGREFKIPTIFRNMASVTRFLKTQNVFFFNHVEGNIYKFQLVRFLVKAENLLKGRCEYFIINQKNIRNVLSIK